MLYTHSYLEVRGRTLYVLDTLVVTQETWTTVVVNSLPSLRSSLVLLEAPPSYHITVAGGSKALSYRFS
jgi:hypothetical protein